MLVDGAVAEDDDEQPRLRRDAHEQRRADDETLVAGPDDDGGAVGQLCEQPARVCEHPLELTVGAREELLDLLLFGLPEPRRFRKVVDEEAVPLVRRDPPGARMRVHEIPVALEGHHVGADRRRRHIDPRRSRDVRRPDRGGGADVLGHHGLQDGGAASLELRPGWTLLGRLGRVEF